MKTKLKQTLAKVLNTHTSKSLEVYDSLEDLSIITFWKIVQGDVNKSIYFLDKKFSNKNKYSEEDESILMETWHKLQDEYYRLQNNPSQRATMRKSMELLKMQFKVRTLLNHYEFYTRFYQINHLLPVKFYFEKEQEILKIFKELGFRSKANDFNSADENIAVIKRYVEAVINKLNRLKEDVHERADKEIKNIYDNVAIIEQILERSVGDIDKVNVMQWIAYEKQAKEIVKAKKKTTNGKK